jgi:DNA-binding transcriptional regulator LsrR (DeoR family)
MSISIDDLKRAPVRVAVAISPDKAEAIRAAVDGGLINAIGTDAATARALMAHPRSPEV